MDNVLNLSDHTITKDEVPTHLTHVSISIDGRHLVTQEERGLDSVNKMWDTKEELIKYLQEIL